MSRTRPNESGDDVIAQLAPMRRYARTLTRDETQAEDLVHDALVRAYERRTTFRAGTNLRTWLLAILHNTFVDRWRQRDAELQREAEISHLAETAAPAEQESRVRLQADRASNDADVSSIPPLIPYGGFSPVRLEGWPVRRGLPGSSEA